MQADRLNIPVGTTLTIESGGDKTCYLVNLIGYLNGASLLVTEPQDIVDTSLAMGDHLIVRYIHDESIVGFESALLYRASEPYPHWHLSYPKGIQGRILRRALRIPFTAPAVANVGADSANQPVRIVDISLTGARVRVPQCGARVGEGYVLELATSQGRSLRLPCHIRHALNRPDGNCELGVEFDELTLDVHHQIEALIRHSMAITRIAH